MATNPKRYLELFLHEAQAHVSSAVGLTGRLGDSSPGGAVRDLYCHAHSLKGLASTLGLQEMSRLAHFAEDVLEQLRQGTRSTPEAVTELLAVFESIESLVDGVEGERLGTEDGRPSPEAHLDSIQPRLRAAAADVASELGKSVELDMDGAHLPLCGAALGSVAVGLIHLIRNAIDHGIEGEDERRARGKPVVGRVRIRVESRRDEVVVVVEDDGRGLDTDALRRCAVDLGLVGYDQLRELDDDAVRLLATHPGLTTREQPDALSGRGFGLAAVRADVEALGGRLWLSSSPGRGTRIEMRLPARLSAECSKGRIAS